MVEVVFECMTVCFYVRAGVCASEFVWFYICVSEVLSAFLIDRVCVCICVLIACVICAK